MLMEKPYTGEYDLIVNAVDCPKCGARKGSMCVHMTSYLHNNQLKRPHSERFKAWRKEQI
jgi:hypothetical protein